MSAEVIVVGSILSRFEHNEDTINRILPSPYAGGREHDRALRRPLLCRIEPPLVAYLASTGVAPKSATNGVFNLFRLQAQGVYVDSAEPEVRKAA
jgi:hypothetical protein